MPKSKTTKSKSTAKPTQSTKKPGGAKKSTDTVAAPPDQTTPNESAGVTNAKKSAPAKAYKAAKPTGLSNLQKAGLAHHVMVRVGDLMEFQDTQFANENLVGIDRKLMGAQLAAWVSYLPGQYWDARLPQPARARGRRKL
jgi:hypothetical protein